MSKHYASKVIKVAEAEVGYLEKKSNSQLDSKTSNAGYNNYTKYACDLDEKYPKFLNGKKNGYDWCAIFVIWCFIKAFGEAIAHTLLCQPTGSLGASCTSVVNYYKANGQWHPRSDTPKVGDQIIFQNSIGPCHTGIVYKVDSTTVYTIEGNTSSAAGVVANGGCVAKKSYSRSSSYILGYGRPKYDKEETVKLTMIDNGAIYEKDWKDPLGGASKLLKNLKKGAKVEFISDVGYGWFKVKYGSITGYMMNSHFITSRASKFSTIKISHDVSAIVVENSKKVGTKKFKKGQEFVIISEIESGKYKGYRYVKVSGKTGRYYIK